MRRRLLLLLFISACEPQNAPPLQPATRPSAPSPQVQHIETSIVHFPSRDKDITKREPTDVSGILVRAPGKHPAVVALGDCHGLSNPLSAEDEAWAKKIRDKGYAVLFVDSFTPRKTQDDCGEHPKVAIRQRWRDAYGAIDFLLAQNFVNGHVGIVGREAGATVVLAAAEAAPPGAHAFSLGIAIAPNCDGAARQTTYAARIPLYLYSNDTACQALVRRRLEIKSADPALSDEQMPDVLFKYLGGKFR